MFNLMFGTIWTIFTLFFMFGIIESEGGIGNLVPFVVIIIFLIIGVVLIISGLKQIITNFQTKHYGMPCYGIINDIQITGSRVNGNPEYKAIVDFVNPETNQQEIREEIVGFDYNKYPINSYVLCKYYKGDINIEQIISEQQVPYNIKQYLVLAPQNNLYTSINFSSDKEYVTIDGVTYKKYQ